MKRVIFFTAVVVVCLSEFALADGKFYTVPERVPPDLPYQRALIAHDGSRELLILQSRFEGEAKDFGWVIPLPAVPELAAFWPGYETMLFSTLDRWSSPSVTRLSGFAPIVLGGLLFVLVLAASRLLEYKKQDKEAPKSLKVTAKALVMIVAGSMALLVLAAFSFVSPHDHLAFLLYWILAASFVGLVGIWAARLACRILRKSWPRSLSVISTTLMVIVFAIAGLPSFMSFFLLGAKAGSAGVEVVMEEQVGLYNVKVIKAKEDEGIVEWLNERGYKFGEADKNAFQDYIERGWCFVTARVDLKKAEREGFSSDEGLVNPLVMLFESEEPVYPLALTGTAGNETVVLLYVLDSHKRIDADRRFPVRYAGEHDIEQLTHYMLFQPEDFVEKWDFKQEYLTKLKARLTPEQMKEDLILQRAPDDEPYREHAYRW